MNQEPPTKVVPEPGISPRFLVGLTAAVLAGVVAFLLGIAGKDPGRAWMAYHVNFVFWAGVAAAGPVFAAILHLTEARWCGSIKRVAAGLAALLPVFLILFLVLFLGRRWLFPWVGHPKPATGAWLTTRFVLARDGLGLLLFTVLSLAFVGRLKRSDPTAGRFPDAGLAAVLLVVYGVAYSLIGYDLIMALSPTWYSTLFGGYYFAESLYAGLAFIAILAILARRLMGLEASITMSGLQDLGRILFSFGLIWIYLFWSQYLVIWYGNLPHETWYVILRLKTDPWRILAVTVLFLDFVIPFCVLAAIITGPVRKTPTPFLVLSILILLGMWLERYLLVVPSLWRGPGMPLGIPEFLIALGFLSGVLLVLSVVARRYPDLLAADPPLAHSASH